MSNLLDLPFEQRMVLRDRFRIDLTQSEAIGLRDYFDEDDRVARLNGLSSATFGEVYGRCGLAVALYALAASDISPEDRRALCVMIAKEAIRNAEMLAEDDAETLANLLSLIGSGNPAFCSHERWVMLDDWRKCNEYQNDPDDSPKVIAIELVMRTLAPALYMKGDDWAARRVEWMPSDCLDQARQVRIAAHPAVNAARMIGRLARDAQARWQAGTGLNFDFLGGEVDTHFWAVHADISQDIEGITDYDIAVALGLEPVE